MEYDLKQKCAMHKRRLDCPDNPVYFWSRLNEYGLIVHDGSGSIITIHFCPWCGTSLKGRSKARRATQKKSRTR